ncbi:MAG: TRAP transporter small permease subunit [Deltaproteobacteria bacterium]|nr:TRAP transporter small permease subunit [Deltaproteobacteria bacterium]MBW1918695.1 TRAP transporter small permease subunit [Deltaproteobacteria bacterium]MBW1936133.1 TRAP transporter small permease subunit [Deltaproteobacteria bacterium]MBW1978220.1 TRAP transporter small permease subunit [Deltaproteobacteria bacterium]MBW2046277.1 TRAP transporter small permease subunit [Deltaproteobacteria bacterium]
MKALAKVDRFLAKMEGWLTITFLGLMVCLSFVHVTLRALYVHGNMHWANILAARIDWAGPMARLLVLWVTFLGASLVTRENKHIKIDLMSDLLPDRILPIRELAISTACVFITALMAKASFSYLSTEMQFQDTLFLGLPSWIGQLILPAGFCLLLFHFLVRGLGQIIFILKGDLP